MRKCDERLRKMKQLESELVANDVLCTKPCELRKRILDERNGVVRDEISLNDVAIIEHVYRLKTALHDTVNSPKGVVPDSALEFYDTKKYYKPCTACGGSGHYDAKNSPKCTACGGTGVITRR